MQKLEANENLLKVFFDNALWQFATKLLINILDRPFGHVLKVDTEFFHIAFITDDITAKIFYYVRALEFL